MIALLRSIRHGGLSNDLLIADDLGDQDAEVGAKRNAGTKEARNLLGQRIHATTLALYSGQMAKVAVIDLDGVVADVRHRLHYVETTPKDWSGFFAACSSDPVLPQGLDLVTALAKDHEILYLSGRPESCRPSTQAWLDRVGAPPGQLILRREGDRRPARITKVELLNSLDREVAIVVDDDPAVLRAMQAAGYATLHADWMSDSPTLFNQHEEFLRLQENGES